MIRTEVMGAKRHPQAAGRAFTIVELMVAMVILVILMAVVASMTDHLGRAWRASSAKVEAFQGARNAFETMTQRMRQATLNTYWDYDDVNNPTRYVRKSELHFITGPAGGSSGLVGDNATVHPTHAAFFIAPLGYTDDRTTFEGLENLLTACGYYVEFGKNASSGSFLDSLDANYRFRLKQLLQPSEENRIYDTYSASDPGSFNRWFRLPLGSASPPVANLADNIIALVMLPMLPPQEDDGTSLAPSFAYDSRRDYAFTSVPPNTNPPVPAQSGSTIHQLPPLMRVIAVAIDEPFASRLNPPNIATVPNLVDPALFQTASQLDGDLDALTAQLNSRPQLNYRVFDTTIALRNAKWSY